jgi:hypothetical protein
MMPQYVLVLNMEIMHALDKALSTGNLSSTLKRSPNMTFKITIKWSYLTSLVFWASIGIVIYHYSHLTIINWQFWVIAVGLITAQSLHELIIEHEAVEKYINSKKEP